MRTDPSIPELLTGQVIAQLRRRRIRAMKLDDKEAVQICVRAAASARDLAAIMKEAYAVRVAADYRPDIAIASDDKGRFQLNLVPVTKAHEWPTRARDLGDRIKRAWNITDD